MKHSFIQVHAIIYFKNFAKFCAQCYYLVGGIDIGADSRPTRL